MQSPLIFSACPGRQSWVSARNQDQAICSLYGQQFKTPTFIPVPENLSPYEGLKLQRFFLGSHSPIIFTSIRPHPLHIINHYKFPQKTRFVFHTYGNFFGELKKWLQLEKTLMGKDVTFLCASEGQKKLISLFFKQDQNVQVLPPSMSEEDWGFDEKKRTSFRAQNSISPDDTLIVYSGRISLQKNIDLIISKINKIACDTSPKKIFLFFAGDFDDLSAPYINIELPEGHSYARWIDSLSKVTSPNLKIKFLGNLNQQERHHLYCAGDFLISLSLHHAEALGVSPLEALASGLPCLLTYWGGYSSFKIENSKLCNLISTKVNNQGCFINETELNQTLDHLCHSPIDNKSRTQEAAAILNHFSKNNSLKRIDDIIKTLTNKFEGFSPLAKIAVEKLYQGYGPRPYPNLYVDIFKEYSGRQASEP